VLAVPDTVDFGTLNVNQTGTISIRISNVGGDSLTITGNSVSSAEALDSNFLLPLTLASGKYRDLAIRFKPSGPGGRSAWDTIHYTSQGKSYSAVMLMISGGGIANTGEGKLVGPAIIDFGMLPTNVAHDTLIRISNVGISDLTIIGNQVSSPEGVDNNFLQPMTLIPGDYRDIHVQFKPSQAGARSATDILSYTTNGNTKSFTIMMQAQGSTSGGGGGGNAPGPGSSFTFTCVTDTNGVVIGRGADSTYTVVSNTLTYQGKTNVLQMRGPSGDFTYYHVETNGDVSTFLDLTALGAPIPAAWFTVPIASKTPVVQTLYRQDTTVDFSGFPLPITLTVVDSATSQGGKVSINANGKSFSTDIGRISVTFRADASLLGNLYENYNSVTIWYSKELAFFLKRIDGNDNVSNQLIGLPNSSSRTTYNIKSYIAK